MGEHPVKNISEPVRVYKVLMDSEDIRTLTEKKEKVPKLKWILAAAVVSIVIVVGALGGGRALASGTLLTETRCGD